MGYKRGRKFDSQNNIRFTASDRKFLNELSAELGISFSDAVRQCVNFTFVVAPVLNQITIWDAIFHIDPEFLEMMSGMKLGGIANGKSIGETDKKV